MTITRELNQLAPDALVTLFDFDLRPITGGGTEDIVHYTNTEVGATNYITWGGINYTPFPFEFKGVENKGDGSALGRPTITVSNVNKVFFAMFLSYGDLTGVAAKRTITAFKYTDVGSNPDPLATFLVNEFTVVKKVSQSKLEITYELSSALDQPGLSLPRRAILRSKTSRNLFAPGVSRVRLR